MITFTSIELILLSGISICFLVQLVYYLFYFSRPTRYGKKVLKGQISVTNEQPGISVIVCAKNESENLQQFLPALLEQDYPLFEVIVVNDGSTDESDEVLGMLENKYSNLYCTYIPEQAKYLSRKKLAITIGLKAAKYPYLLFTEPNCKPVSSNWIQLMARHFDDQTTIVLGFSAFEQSTNIWRKYAAYDNLLGGLKYLSLALFKKTYKGVGRNMAYQKELYYANKGFSNHLNLYPGEDDLFVNQCANKTNTKVEISPESITTTYWEDFRYWKEMKLCQATTQRHYHFGPIAFWRLETFSRILFYGLLIACIVYGLPDWKLPVIAGGLFLIRLSWQLGIMYKLCSYLHIEKFYFSLLWFDIFQPFVDLYFHISRVFKGKKDYTWR